MTAKKAAASKTEAAAPDVDLSASPDSPKPPLMASYDELKDVAAESAPKTKKKD